MQQVKFPIELIIAEDCSTDGTRAICQRYAEEYPDLIRLITSESNVGAIPNERRAMLAAIVSTSISNTVTVNHISTIVNGSSTGVIDVVRKERHQAVKWHITITTADGKEYTSQVFSLPAVGTGNNYGYIGLENKKLKINIVDDTQNVNLILTNQTTSDVRVVLTRMPITPELPQQCDVPSDVLPWIPPQVSAPANSSTVVDEQMPIPGHASVRWIVVVQRSTTKRAFEVTANRNGLVDSSYVQYGMIGDRIDINADVSLVGMSFVLTIHNNTTEAATINIIRLS